jgi:hypothetical protein
MSATCNKNCICSDSDCSFKHYIESYKERKLVKSFYDKLVITKDEPNSDSRKKNCTFGQLCDKENCGYRHRLSYADREKLIVSYRYNKICQVDVSKQVQDKLPVAKKTKEIATKNMFLTLEDEEINDEIEIVNVVEQVRDIAPVEVKPYVGRAWNKVVKNEDKPIPKLDLSVSSSTWEELDDEDFYMKFE